MLYKEDRFAETRAIAIDIFALLGGVLALGGVAILLLKWFAPF